MIKRSDELPPEAFNQEQDDEDAQAQSIAEEALLRDLNEQGLQDSEKVKGGITDDDDTQDLVDHMNQMTSSGAIDMSAYDGEETMDDLENRYGSRNAADRNFADDDS